MLYQNKNISTLRQFEIIKHLYTMQTLYSKELALIFNVTTRTIVRDMQKISSVIPLIRGHGTWKLDTNVLTVTHSPLTHTLMKAFADNVDVDIICFEKSNLSKDKISFAIEYKNLPKVLGENIVDAIAKEVQCSFTYIKPKETSQRVVDPIKLYTENSRWYLVARDYKDDKVKMFRLSKIEHFKPSKQAITLTKSMLQEAKEIKSVWSTSSGATSVRLYVKPEIAKYFEDIKLHKTQTIADRHHDGGLELEYYITHKLEILPAIKSWLPYIHILEPKWLWDDLMRDLEYYKDEDWKMDI